MLFRSPLYKRYNKRSKTGGRRSKTQEETSKNFQYEDTTVIAESQEDLKALIKKDKEQSEKTGLQLNVKKTNIITT